MLLQKYKNRHGTLTPFLIWQRVLLDTFQGMKAHEHCSKGNNRQEGIWSAYPVKL